MNGKLTVTTGKYPSRGWKNGRLSSKSDSIVVTTGKYPSRGWKKAGGQLSATPGQGHVTTGKYPSRGWKNGSRPSIPQPPSHSSQQANTPHGDGKMLPAQREWRPARHNRQIPLTGMEKSGLSPRWCQCPSSQQANTPHGDGKPRPHGP